MASGAATDASADDAIVAVHPRRVAIGAGILAAAYLLVLLVAHPVPNRVLGWLGGPGDDFGRFGGMRMTWQPAAGADRSEIEEIFRQREHGAILQPTGAGYVVLVPGVPASEIDRAAHRIGGEGRLEFHEVLQVEAMKQLANVLQLPMRERPIDVDVDQWSAEGGRQTDYYLRGPTREALEAKLAEAARLGWRLPAGSHLVFEHFEAREPRRRMPATTWRTYVIADAIALDGTMISDALGTYDANSNYPIVLVDFDRNGSRRLADLTDRIVGKKLAIVLDGEIRSAPVITGKIGGGRASITMGGSDVDAQERDRDALVATLRAGALPLGGHILDAAYVPAAEFAGKLWPARLLVALGGGILAAALGWLAVRVLQPRRRRIAALPGTARIWPRVLWTLGGIGVLMLGRQIVLPGVNEYEVEWMFRHARGGSDLSRFSIFTLGVMPVISTFVIVELALSIVPRWRRLRDGGPEARRKVARVIAVLAIVVALVQGYFIAGYLQELSKGGAELVSTGTAARWMMVASLVTGTACLTWVASVIGHRGIGNGYAVLLLATQLLGVHWSALGDVPSGELALGLVTLGCVAVIVVVVMQWRIGGVNTVAIPIPSASLAPLSNAGGVAAALGVLAALGFTSLPTRWLHSLDPATIAMVVIVVATALWSLAFARPGRRRRELERVALSPPSQATWARAAGLSAVMLVAIFAITRTTAMPLLDPIVLVVAIATIADLAAELRDRRRGLIPVWPLHDPLLVDVVRDRLAAAAIPHHLQASRLRTLLWLFGSYVPIMVLVPPDQAVVAERTLRDLLAPESG